MSSPTRRAVMGNLHPDKSMDSTDIDASPQRAGGDTNGVSAHNVVHSQFQDKSNANITEKNDKEFAEASAVVARHVELLREYNEIKDVGQQLMGMVAEKRGVTVGSLYRTGEFGVGPKD
ncbi:DNA repair protein SWI5 [Colletotrichum liriopes]|uniref:DNA repair protein SWI5 n=1 Tax=Colletotrichum liriopes TaxID=708192 RepID=A0AA37LWI5_9PEZI|nr:DNA repair protein SWI5 [Colletotrichum liriopes]